MIYMLGLLLHMQGEKLEKKDYKSIQLLYQKITKSQTNIKTYKHPHLDVIKITHRDIYI